MLSALSWRSYHSCVVAQINSIVSLTDVHRLFVNYLCIAQVVILQATVLTRCLPLGILSVQLDVMAQT